MIPTRVGGIPCSLGIPAVQVAFPCDAAPTPTAVSQEQVHIQFGELETFPAEFSNRISSYILPHVRSTQPDRKTPTSKNHPHPPYSTYLLYLPLASDRTYLPCIYPNYACIPSLGRRSERSRSDAASGGPPEAPRPTDGRPTLHRRWVGGEGCARQAAMCTHFGCFG